MSNAASAYLGIIAGAAVGGVITWWIYNLQNKTSRKQDHILNHIEEIEQKNRKILIHLEAYAKHQDLVLNKIFLLNENIQALNQKMQNMAEEPK
jgi:Na+/glutamate symporter